MCYLSLLLCETAVHHISQRVLFDAYTARKQHFTHVTHAGASIFLLRLMFYFVLPVFVPVMSRGRWPKAKAQ